MKYIYFIIIAPALLLYGMLSYAILSGEISPSKSHVDRAMEVIPNSKLIQVGFSSGSYSCVNGECDYSNVIDQKQYVDFPSLSSIATVTKNYEGVWSTELQPFTLNLKLSLLALYLFFGCGAYLSVRKLKIV